MCLLCCTGGATATPSQDANITDLCRVLNKSQSVESLDRTIYLVKYILFFFYLCQTLFGGLIPYRPMWAGIRQLQVNIVIIILLSFHANFASVGPVP